jgi:predicted metal-dependent hydrolase
LSKRSILTEKIEISNHKTFSYKIVYSKRRSIGISVSPETGVTVHAPFRTSDKTIRDLVDSKSGWILKHLENYKSVVRLNNKAYTDGMTIPYQGRELPTRIIESEKYFIELKGDILEIGLKDISKTDLVVKMLKIWYKHTAEFVFREKFEFLLNLHIDSDFRPSGFYIKALKRRWGSCSSTGKIVISSELIKLDEIYLEYVILHELCHLKHHNHGRDFYKTLSLVFPQWKQVRQELKKYVR